MKKKSYHKQIRSILSITGCSNGQQNEQDRPIYDITFSSSSKTALATSPFCSKSSSKFILGTKARTTAQNSIYKLLGIRVLLIPNKMTLSITIKYISLDLLLGVLQFIKGISSIHFDNPILYWAYKLHKYIILQNSSSNHSSIERAKRNTARST